MVLVGAMIKLFSFQLSVFEKILEDEKRINILSISASSLSRFESIIIWNGRGTKRIKSCMLSMRLNHFRQWFVLIISNNRLKITIMVLTLLLFLFLLMVETSSTTQMLMLEVEEASLPWNYSNHNIVFI